MSYSFNTYNDAQKDPFGMYTEDNTAQFLVSYNINDSTQKNIIYNMSQRDRIFYVGSNSSPSQTMTYCKTVVDNVILPTGAQTHYEYGEMTRYTYFADRTKTDYACISRYDVQSENAPHENESCYEYTLANYPVVTTSFPGRDGYTISEKFDSDGNIYKRTTTCSDLDYVIVEDYDYVKQNGEFLVSEETVTKTNSEGISITYTNSYIYDTYFNEITRITRDGTIIYNASYTTSDGNRLLNYEYYIYGEDDYKGIKNTIKGGVITEKNYALPSSRTDSSPVIRETTTYTYDSYGNIASMNGEGVYVEYSYEYGDYSSGSSPAYSIIITETYPEVENITNSQGVGALSLLRWHCRLYHQIHLL